MQHDEKIMLRCTKSAASLGVIQSLPTIGHLLGMPIR
jgi:hypothetical protein